MTPKEKYDQAFMESFSIDKQALNDSLEYNSVEEWDSVGHMTLIGLLEDTFEIAMDMDDIIDFSSYNKGHEILEKYGVTLGGKK
ncbi:MAG: acyl carrier protein [SAR202 cluster bacterium]|nr:acyl carrier protein [SAR202 cluster bacterium]